MQLQAAQEMSEHGPARRETDMREDDVTLGLSGEEKDHTISKNKKENMKRRSISDHTEKALRVSRL